MRYHMIDQRAVRPQTDNMVQLRPGVDFRATPPGAEKPRPPLTNWTLGALVILAAAAVIVVAVIGMAGAL